MSQTKKHHKSEIQAVLNWLYEHFPQTFFKKGREIKPLQIGIFEDLLDFYERLNDPPFNKGRLKDALNYYSASPAYLLAQKPNTARIDLFGHEVDTVTETQAQYAQERYAERYEKKDATPSHSSEKQE